MANVEEEEMGDEKREEELKGDKKEAFGDGRGEHEGSADEKDSGVNREAEEENEINADTKQKSKAVSENLNGNGAEAGADDLQQQAPEIVRKGESKPIKRGLLDEPIVREGKRQRHAVQRLAALSSPPVKRLSLDAVGSGTSLGDIEYVNFGISKAQNETLKSLHRLCYGTLGTVTSRKRDLRKFNGYAFDEKSSDFEKKKTMAMKLTNNELHAIARILGSERGHTKEEAVMNVLHFLQKPEDKGKKVPKAKKRRHSSKSSGKRAKRSKTEKKGKEGSADKKKKSKEAATEESYENDDAGQSGEESSGDENVEESKIPTKRMLEKAKSPGKSDVSSSKSNEAKIEPSWGDGGPSNEEVETAISEILRSVDLVNCTMKQMCERIAEQFPNLDMTTYKAALKERVKAALEKMEDS